MVAFRNVTVTAAFKQLLFTLCVLVLVETAALAALVHGDLFHGA